MSFCDTAIWICFHKILNPETVLSECWYFTTYYITIVNTRHYYVQSANDEHKLLSQQHLDRKINIDRNKCEYLCGCLTVTCKYMWIYRRSIHVCISCNQSVLCLFQNKTQRKGPHCMPAQELEFLNNIFGTLLELFYAERFWLLNRSQTLSVWRV